MTVQAKLSVLALLVVVAVAWPSGRAWAQQATPTPSSNCCSPHEAAGCDTSSCQACVCAAGNDSDCCNADVGWDEICVAIVTQVCFEACPCGPAPTPSPTPGGDCCGSHDGPGCDVGSCQSCVCALDDLCCSRSWDATCVSEALNECAIACPCETAGDCCARHSGAGCEAAECQTCVCDADSACCTSGWDQFCVDIAGAECLPSCFCEAAGSCCAAHGGPGCEIRNCQECVCGIDDGCCRLEVGWDELCVAVAEEDCIADCGCEPEADCCAPNGGAGCDESLCESCVCSFDFACCDPELGWDESCVSVAGTECLAFCGCPTDGSCCEAHVGVGCDQRQCIPCVCQLDPGCCTDGWDATCADEAAKDCATRCNCGLVSDCCHPHDSAGCEEEVCENCVCAQDGFCCSGDIWDSTCSSIAAAECADICLCEACVADCNGDGEVSLDELIVAVNIAIGNFSVFRCPPADVDGDGRVTIDEVLAAVADALDGC